MLEESLRYFCGFARFANETHLSCVAASKSKQSAKIAKEASATLTTKEN